ncbi:MAG: bifunctional adenosylcobinamide kinase/adenosylcobinamide-phosphate guanylyltransferase [Verrucomicrobia bacterium]|nr:bifunctional adenosylcobinamide kinase/adenosylcobinamide-phosphate guanylyltransferase [Cytophagales bacterium]
MIHFITGGERSGKSGYAQKTALLLSDNPVYVATARKWDADFEKRIQRHQAERTENWTNLETEKYISQLNLTNQTIVLDCVTLWLTNFYADNKYDLNKSLTEAKAEFECFSVQANNWIIISNEIGMGVHADTAIARKFVELQGWTNQYIAEKAATVTLMVSGIPLKIK